MQAGITRYYRHLGGALVLASAALVAFIGQWESGGDAPVLTVYADQLAGGLPTVCHGLTRHVTKAPIIVGQAWTSEQCEREEQAALLKVQDAVAHCFQVLPPQSVFDAASSHAWNLGAAATCGSSAMRSFNRSDWATGCRRLSRGDDGRIVWAFTSRTDAQGRKTYVFRRGLARRRAAESDFCMDDVTGKEGRP